MLRGNRWKRQIFFAAMEDSSPKGFLCLKETGKNTVELAVMGEKWSRSRAVAWRMA